MKPFQILLAVTVLLCLLPATGAEPDKRWQKRWVYIPSNLYVNENLTKLEDLLKRARQAGDNGVLFADYKTFTWWQLDTPDRWEKNAKARRQLTRKLDLELVVCCLPFGRANALLWHDPDLASGMPIRNAPVRVEGNQLVPVATAAIRHGSFEEHRGDTPPASRSRMIPATVRSSTRKSSRKARLHCVSRTSAWSTRMATAGSARKSPSSPGSSTACGSG